MKLSDVPHIVMAVLLSGARLPRQGEIGK